eukprot:g1366.t1
MHGATGSEDDDVLDDAQLASGEEGNPVDLCDSPSSSDSEDGGAQGHGPGTVGASWHRHNVDIAMALSVLRLLLLNIMSAINRSVVSTSRNSASDAQAGQRKTLELANQTCGLDLTGVLKTHYSGHNLSVEGRNCALFIENSLCLDCARDIGRAVMHAGGMAKWIREDQRTKCQKAAVALTEVYTSYEGASCMYFVGIHAVNAEYSSTKDRVIGNAECAKIWEKVQERNRRDCKALATAFATARSWVGQEQQVAQPSASSSSAPGEVCKEVYVGFVHPTHPDLKVRMELTPGHVRSRQSFLEACADCLNRFLAYVMMNLFLVDTQGVQPTDQYNLYQACRRVSMDGQSALRAVFSGKSSTAGSIHFVLFRWDSEGKIGSLLPDSFRCHRLKGMFEACEATRAEGVRKLLSAAEELVGGDDGGGEKFPATRVVMQWLHELSNEPGTVASPRRALSKVRAQALQEQGPERLVDLKVSTAAPEIALRYGLATKILERLGGGIDSEKQMQLVRCLYGCQHEVTVAFLQSVSGLGSTRADCGAAAAQKVLDVMLGDDATTNEQALADAFMGALEQFTSTSAESTIRRDKLRRALGRLGCHQTEYLRVFRDELAQHVIGELKHHPSSRVLEYNFMRQKEAREALQALQRASGACDSDVSTARASEKEAGEVLEACMKWTMSGNLLSIVEDMMREAERVRDNDQREMLENMLIEFCRRGYSSEIMPVLVDMMRRAEVRGDSNQREFLQDVLIEFCRRGYSAKIVPVLVDMMREAERVRDNNQREFLQDVLIEFCRRGYSANIVPVLVDMMRRAEARGDNNQREFLEDILIEFCRRGYSANIVPVL